MSKNKITLKTLAEATDQEVFDQVAEHLLTQNAVSEGLDSCMYRNPNGLKCAAGCLIADSEYTEKFEGLSWNYLTIDKRVPAVHKELIRDLQHLHDSGDPESWPERLKTVAKTHGLKFSFKKGKKKNG